MERIICNQDDVLGATSFRLGAPIAEEYQRAVKGSRFTLLILSPAYLADQWGVFGKNLVFYLNVAEQRYRLIPMAREQCELPLNIEFLVQLDCTAQDRWEAKAKKLRELLKQPEPELEHIKCPYPGMGAFSDERALVANGGFLGAGTMSARLRSESKGTASAVACVSVDGKQWLEDEDLNNVNRDRDGMVMSLEGLRADQTGNLGTLCMRAADMKRADYEAEFGLNRQASNAGSASTDAFLQDGAITSTILYLNNPSAYLLKGWKWTATDPQINLILKNDAVLASEGLGTNAQATIAAAANIWDNAVAKNLFADGNALVTLDPGANVDTRDNRNVHAWAPIILLAKQDRLLEYFH